LETQEQTTQQAEPLTRPRIIDPALGEFTANGRRYTICQTFTIERYAIYQKLERELGYGMTFKSMFDRVNLALAQLNKMKLVDAIVTLNDLQRGMSIIEEKEPHVLRVCALVFNRDDEDVRVITEDMITEKIKDWKAEGLEMDGFFRYALLTLDGYKERYQSVTRIISALEAAEEKLDEEEEQQ
jgi:hypothetical protein